MDITGNESSRKRILLSMVVVSVLTSQSRDGLDSRDVPTSRDSHLEKNCQHLGLGRQTSRSRLRLSHLHLVPWEQIGPGAKKLGIVWVTHAYGIPLESDNVAVIGHDMTFSDLVHYVSYFPNQTYKPPAASDLSASLFSSTDETALVLAL